MKEIYDYQDYRDFLNEHIKSLPRKGRGVKKELAQNLLCQSTHISQVLGKKSNLTPEQGIKIGKFLPLTSDEKRYFMILLNLARSGSKDLKNFYEEEKKEFLKKRARLLEKLKTKILLDQNQQREYYSNWYYPAIHVLLSIPEFQSPQALIEYLPLPDEKILRALSFLVETGLAQKEKGRYILGSSSLEKPQKNSDLYKIFLNNYRNQAIFSTDRGKKDDYHNTILFSVSSSDIEKINTLISDFFQKVDQLIPDSKEEKLKVLSVDFFGLI